MRHGIVSGIIMPPHSRPAHAVLSSDNKLLRWPGPFGSGFLSPQPPGIVGIGPDAAKCETGPTKVGPFCFWAPFSFYLELRAREAFLTVVPAQRSRCVSRAITLRDG